MGDPINWLVASGDLKPRRDGGSTVELGSRLPASYPDMCAALKAQYPDRLYVVFRHGTRHWVERRS